VGRLSTGNRGWKSEERGRADPDPRSLTRCQPTTDYLFPGRTVGKAEVSELRVRRAGGLLRPEAAGLREPAGEAGRAGGDPRLRRLPEFLPAPAGVRADPAGPGAASAG